MSAKTLNRFRVYLKNLIDFFIFDSAVLIASALTAEANKQSRFDDKQRITMEERNNNNNVKKSAQPRFNFFDYSMIPDKDPRAFVPNKQKKQHEEMFGKDQN